MERKERQQNRVYLSGEFADRYVSSASLYLQTLKIYRVGDMMIAPTWCFLMPSSSLSNRSITGIKKARVLPLPVTA